MIKGKIQTAERTSIHEPSDRVILSRHLIAYKKAIDFIKGKVLEIGCGEGYAIPMLIPASMEYIGLDKSNLALKIRQALSSTQSVNEVNKFYFHQQNVPPLYSFPDNCIDVVLSFQVIEHIKDDDLFLREIKRVLKPGGKVIITTPNRSMSLTKNPYHIREYSKEEIKSLFSKHFQEVIIKGVNGDDKVMRYYHKNKLSVQRIMRLDFLKLYTLIPDNFLKIPYTIMNRVNRHILYKLNLQDIKDINENNFIIGEALHSSLDYMIIATA
jgi:SAM-dependent methyltransferase